MKFLEDILESQEKLFTKGGKFEKLYPLFEAGQTFLFNPKTKTQSGPQVRDSLDTKRFMSIVVLALIPCTLFGIYNAGYQAQYVAQQSLDLVSVMFQGLKITLPIILTSYAVGGLCEALFSIVRRHEINEGFLVTGLLFPLTLPPTIPLWQVALGIAFGVIIGKEIFGGTGKNFLNPALTARAFVYFAFPAKLTGDAIWTAINAPKETLIDGFTGATPLAIASLTQAPDSAVTALANAGYTIKTLFWGLIPGSIGETSTALILVGAIILIATGVGSYRTMIGGVVGAVVMTLLLNLGDTPFMALSPLWQLNMGSFFFAIVFMATDPVSSPGMKISQWIYGLLIGMIGMIIRVMNPAYPEGWMLAILFMNVFAPFIDHWVIQAKIAKRIPNAI